MIKNVVLAIKMALSLYNSVHSPLAGCELCLGGGGGGYRRGKREEALP